MQSVLDRLDRLGLLVHWHLSILTLINLLRFIFNQKLKSQKEVSNVSFVSTTDLKVWIPLISHPVKYLTTTATDESARNKNGLF